MGSYWRSREGVLRTSEMKCLSAVELDVAGEGSLRGTIGECHARTLAGFKRGSIWIDGKGLDPCQTNPGGTFGTRRLRTGLAPSKFLDIM
jgi:hypothetical protein